MPDRVRDPWSERWDIRESMRQLAADATEREMMGLGEMYVNSAMRLGTEVLIMVNQDTERRMSEL